MGLGSAIRDPEKTYSGSRIQGPKRHRIPDPDPQHCLPHYEKLELKRTGITVLPEGEVTDGALEVGRSGRVQEEPVLKQPLLHHAPRSTSLSLPPSSSREGR
jgi:hypothetical protein